MAYRQTYNPCDECPYSFTKNNQESGMCKICEFKQLLDNTTAEVAEVKHGEWIPSKTEFGWNCCEYPVEYTCSVCGRTESQEEPYCHCGAKMDGRSET